MPLGCLELAALVSPAMPLCQAQDRAWQNYILINRTGDVKEERLNKSTFRTNYPTKVVFEFFGDKLEPVGTKW